MIKLFLRKENVEDWDDFQCELRSFAHCSGVQFEVSCRGSIVIFCMDV